MSKRNKHFPSRNIYPVIHFYPEGSVTESAYISDLADFLLEEVTDIKLRHRIKGNIKIHPPHFQDPKNLVDQVIKEETSSNNIAVVIVDEDDRTTPVERSRRNDAIKSANKHKIRFVYSVPCFEFWALLHFINTDRYLSSQDCQRELQKYMPSYNHKHKQRHLDFEKMKLKQKDATKRVLQIIANHNSTNSYGGIDLENPTSNAFIIIDELKKFITNFPR